MLALQGFGGNTKLGCKRQASRAVAAVSIVIAVLSATACGGGSPTMPSSFVLAGRWTGTLTGRTPCAGDWSSVTVTLNDSGSGELVTADGQHFSAAEVLDNDVRRVDVTVPPGQGECSTIQFVVVVMDRDASGRPSAISGDTIGRCCGTVSASFELSRAST